MISFTVKDNYIGHWLARSFGTDQPTDTHTHTQQRDRHPVTFINVYWKQKKNLVLQPCSDESMIMIIHDK